MKRTQSYLLNLFGFNTIYRFCMKKIFFHMLLGALGLLVSHTSTFSESPSPREVADSHSPRELIGFASKIAGTATTPRDYSEMIYYLDKALASNAIVPEHRDYAQKLKGWSHNRLGEHFASQGKESAALTQFETAVELNFKHWKALHNRGVSYAMNSRLNEAAQDFSATIRLHPEYANAWFNRAEVFMRQGKTELAIENYSQAIALDAEDAGFYTGRGEAYRLQGKFALAEADLNRALALDNRLIKARLQRGELWLAQGNYEKAAADYRAAVRNDPRSAEAFRCVAWMMATCEEEKFRDPKRSLQFAKKAIELKGEEDFRLLDTMAAAHANAGQFNYAMTEQQRAIEMATGKATGQEFYELKKRLQQYAQQAPYRTEVIARQSDRSEIIQ